MIKKSVDYLNGKLFPMILKFSIPAAVSLLITAVYNIVDRMFVGNFNGTSALASWENAAAIFKQLDGFGLSRVDFFVEKETGEVIFNEINTFPGFTNISMYPMLWEAEGKSKTTLIDELISLAFSK